MMVLPANSVGKTSKHLNYEHDVKAYLSSKGKLAW